MNDAVSDIGRPPKIISWIDPGVFQLPGLESYTALLWLLDTAFDGARLFRYDVDAAFFH